MSKGESTLGIVVNTDGLKEAGQKLKDLSGDLKGIQQGTAEASKQCQKLGDDTAKAFDVAGKAAEALAQGEADLADQQQKLEDGIKGLKNAIESLPEQLQICSDEHNRRMKEAKEAAEKLKNEMGGLKDASEALSSVYDKVSSFRDSLVNAYKGLEDAREKLKFFSDSASEAENTIQNLSKAATDWQQSEQALTDSATSLIKEGLSTADLEGIVKAAVASKNDLNSTTQAFISASKGESEALKNLKENYKLNLDQLKEYGFTLDKTGAISAKTAEEQKRLASALSEIAKTQYNDAIIKQQETLAGAIAKMENALEKAKKTFGEALAPSVKALADALSSLVDAFNSLDPATQKTIAKMGALLGSITLAVAGIGKLVGIAISAKTAYAGMIAQISKMTGTLTTATTATATTATAVSSVGTAATTAAGSTSALGGAVTALLNPLNLLVVACGAVAYAMIDMYAQQQKIESARLDAESKTQTAYYQDIRQINKELEKQGLNWKDIGDKAKEARIVEILSKSKDGAQLLNKALNDTNQRLKETQSAIGRIDKQIEDRQTAKKWTERISKGLSYAGLDSTGIISEGLNWLSGDIGDTSGLEAERLKKLQQQAQLKREQGTLTKGTEAIKAEEARNARIAKFEEERKKQEEERQKAEENRANVLKEKLNDILESAKGLKPTDEGIERTNALLQTWVKIKDANTALITGNKELNKLWDRGYKALDDQLTKLVETWEAVEAKKRAEKVFGDLLQQENDLQGKSLLDQKAGLDSIIAAYNDILQHDKIITQNAEYRKQAEEAVKNLSAERLEIEEKIANLQKTAQQELRTAQEEGLKIETDLVKMQKEQADAKGNKAESQRLEKRLKELEARQKDIDARKDMEAYNAQKQEIIDKYAPKLKASEGTSAYGTYLSARQRELDNLEKNRSLQKQQAEWKIEQEEINRQKEAQEALNQGKQQETAQTVKASNSLDKLSKSADKASASLDKQAQNQNMNEWGGMKAKVQSGKPVEILETADTYNPQKWEWTPSYEMIKVMDQIKGINLPSVGTPMPKEMFSSKSAQYNTYTNNVTVNGIPAANQTVDSRQIALHAANLAETELSRKLSANGINNYC